MVTRRFNDTNLSELSASAVNPNKESIFFIRRIGWDAMKSHGLLNLTESFTIADILSRFRYRVLFAANNERSAITFSKSVLAGLCIRRIGSLLVEFTKYPVIDRGNGAFDIVYIIRSDNNINI
jgi:hypothetical protein